MKPSQDKWTEEVRAAVVRVASRQTTFLIDDVWKELSGVRTMGDRRKIGPVLLAMRRVGEIEATGQWVASAQPQCHANPRRVWRKKQEKRGEGK